MSAKKKASKSTKKSKKRKVFKIILFALCIIILSAIGGGVYLFKSWKSEAVAKAFYKSDTIMTSMGPIEYKSMGTGPVILLSHMGGSGSDNIVFFKRIAQAGFQIICPSRPGYLGTPLTVNADFEYQADLYAELLNSLKIKEKVYVMGVSLGGPPAIEFAHKYPQKCKALILHSAITRQYTLGDEYSSIYKKITSKNFQNIYNWLSSESSKYFKNKHLEKLLELAADQPEIIIEQMAEYLAMEDATFFNLQFFDETTSPFSMRTNGLENDLKYAKNYQTKKLKVPILITHSTIDKLVRFNHANSFVELNPEAELFSYEGFGHAFWFGDEWEKIKEKTLNFLKETEESLKPKPKPKKPVIKDKNIRKLVSNTWVNRDNGAMLKIYPNGSFTLDFPGVDSNANVSGAAQFTKTHVTFYVSSKRFKNYCFQIKGRYKYSFKKDELILEVVSDKCFQRTEHFTAGWFKL